VMRDNVRQRGLAEESACWALAHAMQSKTTMHTPARVSTVLGLLLLAGCSSASAPGETSATDSASSTAAAVPPRTQSCADCVTAEPAAPAPATEPSALTAPPAASSPSDGAKNGDETDVDCGGAAAPKCAVGLGCATASDCASRACGEDKKCLVAPSCTGGVGAGDQCNGESCCTSVRVPDVGAAVDYSIATTTTSGTTTITTTTWNVNAHVSAYRMDKYEVTVGRLRSFFKAMDGNPQARFEATMGANAGAHPKIAGSGWNASWNKRLPASWTDINSRYGDPALTPTGTQFCMRGAHGDYGTTTWTADADANPQLVDNFDMKPIVCVDWYTLFAFCAWDGGRLPTSAEWGAAAGDDVGFTYPWGNDPMTNANVVTALNAFVGQWPNFTWGLSYRTAFDRGTHVAPVGSKSASRYGLHDLGGNAMEWLLDSKIPSGTCTDCADLSNWKDPTLAWPNGEAKMSEGDPTWKDGGYRVVRGGSWEGHDVSNLKGTWNGIEAGFTYHALGGRCARDL
jgi:formylglycine-generating enzyme